MCFNDPGEQPQPPAVEQPHPRDVAPVIHAHDRWQPRVYMPVFEHDDWPQLRPFVAKWAWVWKDTEWHWYVMKWRTTPRTR